MSNHLNNMWLHFSSNKTSFTNGNYIFFIKFVSVLLFFRWNVTICILFSHIDMKLKWTILLKWIDTKWKKIYTKYTFLCQYSVWKNILVVILFCHSMCQHEFQKYWIRKKKCVFFFVRSHWISYLIRYGHWFCWVTFDWIMKECQRIQVPLYHI